MINFLENSLFFGVFISVLAYGAGVALKHKFKYSLLNPLLISIIIVMIFLGVTGIKYDKYNEGAKFLSYLLTPATVCLAIPLYKKFELLKRNYKAIMAGILSGVATSLCSVLIMSIIVGFDHKNYVTLLPKSITTAIGMGVSEELGGYVTLTVAVIIVTGIIGNIFAELVCKIFRINEPVAKGIAIGSSSHAIGTTKAMEMGTVEGAMSSLSIAVSGLITVVGASIFAQFL